MPAEFLPRAIVSINVLLNSRFHYEISVFIHSIKFLISLTTLPLIILDNATNKDRIVTIIMIHFSLVELIVVIAIMAVMTSVLAPALLKYVEESRAQKDNSAMNEVTHAIKLALANEDVYDECLAYTFKDNYSAYAERQLNHIRRAIKSCQK